MLNENIRAYRRAKGLSQEELAARLHVVRQTVSKWEQGLSVPDAELLIALAEALETPVSALLEETPPQEKEGDLQRLSEQLEALNLQLAKRRDRERRVRHVVFLVLCVCVVVIFAGLWLLHSPYLDWNFSDPETAVLGTAFHVFEWLFVRAAPLLLAAAAIGAYYTRRK